MNRHLTALACLAFVSMPSLAGDINPPAGNIAPTMKTLDQVEARIPIGSLTTPGDNDSVYRITQPGSYYLTGNIQGVSGKHGIQIEASNVSIDLNGYSLLGVPGALAGIVDRLTGEFSNIRSFAVANGAISDFPHGGIVMEYCSTASFSDLTIRGGQYGIYQRAAMTVENCIVSNVSSIGVYAESSAVISRVVVMNAPVGMHTSWSVVNDSAARDCTTGFEAYDSTLRNCVAVGGTTGVKLGLKSVLADSKVSGSQTGVVMEGGHGEVRDSQITSCSSTGILANGSSNRIVGNTVSDCHNAAGSFGYGIRIDAPSTGNVIDSNTGTRNFLGVIVSGTNNVVTRNAFGATVGTNSPVVYQIAAGNRHGPLVKANTNASSVSVAATSSTVAGTMTTTDPNANLFW